MAAMLKRKAIVREQRVKNRRLKAQSRAGNTTKIHLAVDGYGLPVEFEITGGEVNDCSAAPDLIARLPDAKAIVADKGYDKECIREQITKKGARAVIPTKRNSLKGNADMDWGLYQIPALGGECYCPAKAVSGNSNTIRQTEAKLREYGSHGVWISVATYVKCQQTLRTLNNGLKFDCYLSVVRLIKLKPKQAGMTG